MKSALKFGQKSAFKMRTYSPVKQSDKNSPEEANPKKATDKTYDDGTEKNAREQDFSKRHSDEMLKDWLIETKGFDPVEADQMMKTGAYTMADVIEDITTNVGQEGLEESAEEIASKTLPEVTVSPKQKRDKDIKEDEQAKTPLEQSKEKPTQKQLDKAMKREKLRKERERKRIEEKTGKKEKKTEHTTPSEKALQKATAKAAAKAAAKVLKEWMIGVPENKPMKSNIQPRKSPAKQEGPIDKKNPKLGESEHPDTWVYPGGDKSERINDLEDRIEFIREDIWNAQSGPADADADESQGSDKQKKDLAKLRQELAILRKSTHPNKMKGSPAKQAPKKKIGSGTPVETEKMWDKEYRKGVHAREGGAPSNVREGWGYKKALEHVKLMGLKWKAEWGNKASGLRGKFWKDVAISSSPTKQGLLWDDETQKWVDQLQGASESNRKYRKRLKGKVEAGEMSKDEFKEKKKNLRKNLPHRIKSNIKHAIKGIDAKRRNRQATRIATRHEKLTKKQLESNAKLDEYGTVKELNKFDRITKRKKRIEKKMERKGISKVDKFTNPKLIEKYGEGGYERATKNKLGAYNITPKKKK